MADETKRIAPTPRIPHKPAPQATSGRHLSAEQLRAEFKRIPAPQATGGRRLTAEQLRAEFKRIPAPQAAPPTSK